jgi:hypothetical protein
LITLSEEQAARLLLGQEVTISVGEPWDFESPDGENVLKGRVIEVLGAAGDGREQRIRLEVTPFEAPAAKTGRTVTHLVAERRHRDTPSVVEAIATGGRAVVNLSYAEEVPDGELSSGRSPFLIGSVELADRQKDSRPA